MKYLILTLIVLGGVSACCNSHYFLVAMYIIKIIFDILSRFLHFICEWIKTLYRRKQTYCIYQNMSSYIEAVRKMNLCKYFQFVRHEPLNGDITIFMFEIMGIHPEYLQNMEVLKNILTAWKIIKML